MKLNRKTINISLILASLLIAFLMGEFLFRVLGYKSYADRQQSLYGAYEFDSELGWVPKKQYSFMRKTHFYTHMNYYNPDGLPTDGEHIDKPLSKAKPSIALLGDSFVESYYLPYRQSFPCLLDKAVPDIQVINLGVSGYAPDQYLMYARRMIPYYNVKEIIVVFFPYNDVPYVMRDRYRNYAKPYFLAGDYSKPVNLPLPNLSGYADDKRPYIFRLVMSILRRSVVYSELRDVVANIVSPPIIETNIDYAYDKSGFYKSLQIIRQIHLDFPSRDFMIYYLPTLGEVEDIEAYQRNLNLYFDFCQKFQLRCADFGEALIGYEIGARKELFIKKDGHLSNKGAELLTQHLLKMRNQYSY